jgi:hypothetical protein
LKTYIYNSHLAITNTHLKFDTLSITIRYYTVKQQPMYFPNTMGPPGMHYTTNQQQGSYLNLAINPYMQLNPINSLNPTMSLNQNIPLNPNMSLNPNIPSTLMYPQIPPANIFSFQQPQIPPYTDREFLCKTFNFKVPYIEAFLSLTH